MITSAGAGSAAAIAINADLVLDDVERAVADFAGAPFSADMESHVSERNLSTTSRFTLIRPAQARGCESIAESNPS